MAFELKVLLESALIPASVTLAFAVVAWLLEARLPATFIAGMVVVGWWLGLMAGHTGIVPWAWWSDEHWQRLPFPLLITGLLLGPSAACCKNAPWRLLAMGSLACLTGWIVIPHDEAWKDMWPEQSAWMALLVSSSLWNHWSMEDLLDRQGSRWGIWILVSALAAVLILAAASYATMAQWVLAALSATFAIAFLGIFRPSLPVKAITPCVCLVIASMLAWSRFRGELKPMWLYAAILFSPTIIALADRLAEKRVPYWGRVALAATLASSLLVIVIIDAMGSGHEDW